MIRRPPRSTRTDTLFPTRRSSDLGMSLSVPTSVAMISSTSPTASSLIALRSEEHTSELQSLMRISYAVFCLKKKTNKQKTELTYGQNDTNFLIHQMNQKTQT